MSATLNEITVLTIPKKIDVKTQSPIECLKSMGLLTQQSSAINVTAADIKAINDNIVNVETAIWKHVGGVNIARLINLIIIHKNGDIESPVGAVDLQRSPLTFCKTFDINNGLSLMTMLSVNTDQKIIDVCIYDPKKVAKEEMLYTVAGSIGGWLRSVFGDGWGLRIEVYCNKYAPVEVPDLKDIWLLLMIVIKTYMPHVRMLDAQAAIRVESLASNMSMRDILLNFIHNIRTISGDLQSTATL